MGLFDFLSSEKRKANAVERAIRSANNKFKPKDYRQIALREVIDAARAGNENAIAGLLARYNVNAEPSSEDENEKEWVYDALVDLGKKTLPNIRRSLRTAESITWVQRTLKAIVSKEEYTEELLEVLSDFDTEYERNPDRKIQTIAGLADCQGEKVVEAVLRFLDDVDETVRFQTVVTLAKLENPIAREPMLKTMCEDESIRVRNEVVEAFARLGWLTTGYKKKVDGILPQGYKHDKSGKIVKLGSN